MSRDDRNNRTGRNSPSWALRFGPLANFNSPSDQKKTRVRKLYLVVTAAQIGVTLLLVGAVGVFVWKILSRYQ